MNKRILGVRIGTVVTAVLCLAVALVFWMLVKYVSASESLMVGELAEGLYRGFL